MKHDAFIHSLTAAFFGRYSVRLKSIVTPRGIHHRRDDGADLTAEQALFIVAFDLGYSAAEINARHG